jgi:hypothetical protein
VIVMTPLFGGVLNRASVTVIDPGASIWVMNRRGNQQAFKKFQPAGLMSGEADPDFHECD